MAKKIIYLDDAATTPVHPIVVHEMEKFFTKSYGNPSSLHYLGDDALKIITEARRKIALEIGCKAHEVVFTSGATESNNLALHGIARANKNKEKNKILISSIEHPSVSESAEHLVRQGYLVKKIPVSKEGFVDIDFIKKEIDNKILLVSVMHVNNVFGTIQNLKKIGDICRKKRVLFHSDACQSFGKLKIPVKDWNVDLLSISGHKIGGPKGIGALYVREDLDLMPLFFGGGQERGLRSGTENVPAILGFSKALEIYKKKDFNKIIMVRDLFIKELEKIGGKINGSSGEGRIFNNIHVSFSGANAEEMIHRLSEKGIYVSAGSACDSKKQKEDLILKAIGLSEKEARSSIRITFDDNISEKEVIRVVGEIKKLLDNNNLFK